MNRKKRRIVVVLLLFLFLIGPPTWITYRDVRQARLDYALIQAIKARDNQKTLELLTVGANGEARDIGPPPTLQEAALHLLDRFRHSHEPVIVPVDLHPQEHLPALLLLYSQASQSPNDNREPDLAVVRALLDHGARANDQDTEGYSPLEYAAGFSNVDAVRLLLAHGADVNAKDTRLERTVLLGTDAAVTEALIAYGADMDATDIIGKTALMYAALGRRQDVVRILLEHGASVSPKDPRHQTALDLIKTDPDPDSRKIANLLRKYGAK